MKFLIEIEVTPESIWLDGSSDLLRALERSEKPLDLLHEIVWRRIGNKEPLVQVGKVTRA